MVFDLLMSPASLNSAKWQRLWVFPRWPELRRAQFKSWCGAEKNYDFDKQFIGAVVCSLMEANGYEKTGKKRSIPHNAFTKGEVYARSRVPD